MIGFSSASLTPMPSTGAAIDAFSIDAICAIVCHIVGIPGNWDIASIAPDIPMSMAPVLVLDILPLELVSIIMFVAPLFVSLCSLFIVIIRDI